MTNANPKSVQEIVHEMKNDLIDFVATRVAMFSGEMSEKARAWKTAVPSLVIGSVLLLTAWFLLSACLVALVAMAFNPPWNYAIAMAIVCAAYLLIGGMIASMGLRTMKNTTMAPERTLRTLKQDQVWLQTEVKTEL